MTSDPGTLGGATQPALRTATGTLTVVVLTYRRPHLLAVALPELLDQLSELDAASGIESDLLVIDNDPDESARELVTSVPSTRVRYLTEKRRGIAAARNRALDETADRDLIVFIDDDERARPGWLVRLTETYIDTRPTAVMGRVISDYPDGADPWVVAGDFLRRPSHRTGDTLAIAATNNLLLDRAAVRGLGLRFDETLGLSGGEDNLFTRQLVRRGGRIVWCDEAVLDDEWPTERLQRRWLLHRSFSHGNTAAIVDALMEPPGARRAAVRVRRAAGGAGRVVLGLGRWAVGSVTGDLRHRARGQRGVYRGCGMVSGAIGRVYQEYARREQTT
ncbi:glycosyltransferase [Leifsonia sp. fls2-241-R2A-40a]|uniref:glycosyltransferase family 2 protein n=1 Tax=Leifsonia sp. fls2-241-R2A-40a TaxID=3040290 RepID=UPI00254DEE1E|nr:glycosyltransferase [Leifsonia sp. fls2-241-R2A-40a]